MFNNSEDMFLKEKEIVTEEFLLRNDVYNLNTGGKGGFDYINKNSLNGFNNPDVARKGRELTNILMEKRYGKNWRTIIAKIASLMSNTVESKEKAKKTKIKNGTYGKTEHLNSEPAILKKKETFKKINHQSGINNSQYGKIWITNGTDSKSINKNDSIPAGWRKGRVLKNKKPRWCNR